jgi:dCMP deaminase
MSDRPDRDGYYMGIAMAVRRRANCLGNKVGALLVLSDRIISTGYNGTPQGMRNCDEGGCERCADRQRFPTGQGYDLCICVHAEQNALLAAARFGIGVEGAILYTTLRPCFGCLKEALQAGVSQIRYLHDWRCPEEMRDQYAALEEHFAAGVRRVQMEDPEAGWAVSRPPGGAAIRADPPPPFAG